MLVVAVVAASLVAGTAFAQTAPSIAFNTASCPVVAADVASPPYKSPHSSTNIGLQIRNATADQVVRITTDKGTIALGANLACPGASGAVVASAKTSTVTLTFCARQADGLGVATIAAENMTTAGSTATTTVTLVGPPAQVRGTASGNSVRVTVLDAAGSNVVDGTPVWFAIPPSTTFATGNCSTTAGGVRSLGLNASEALQTVTTGTVFIAAGWNEAGDDATCARQPLRQVTATVSLNVATPVPVEPVTGAISGGTIPKTGGFGIIVYSGLVTSLASITGCPPATAAFWTGINGRFVPYVPGTAISAVNAEFLAAFPNNNIPPDTAIIGKCR